MSRNFIEIGPASALHPLLEPKRPDEDYDDPRNALYTLLEKAYTEHGSRRCLGRRSKETGEYVWQTYAELGVEQAKLAAFLVAPEQVNGAGLARSGLFVLLAPNCPEWIVAEHAALRMALVNVPLFSTLRADSVAFILRQTEVRVAVSYKSLLPVLLDAAEAARMPLKTVVVIPDTELTQADIDLAAGRGTRLVLWQRALEIGAEHPVPAAPAPPNDTATIVYTSGTTGDPKGVMLSGKNMATSARTLLSVGYLFGATGKPCDEVHMSFLPLAHVFERQFIASLLQAGAAIGFMRGTIAGLFDDIEALRPTILIGVPRVWKRLRDRVTQSIESSGYVRRTLFNYALYSKACREEGSWGFVNWDSLLFSKLRQKLGGNCVTFVSGGAALSADMSAWLSRCFCVRVFQGYGLSETMGGIFLQIPPEPGCAPQFRDSIGYPHWDSYLRVVDVSEMGYYTKGQDTPCGELWIKGPTIFSGYYKDEVHTQESLVVNDSGTWLRTGDIGKINQDGSITIFDRLRSVFKLAQGEFVAAEFLESIYSLSPLVAQVWIHGEQTDSYVSAVVCPNFEQLRAAVNAPPNTTDEELCAMERARDLVRDSFDKIAGDNKVPGFQRPQTVLLDVAGFTQENELCTPTFKYKRSLMRKKFAARLAEMNKALRESSAPSAAGSDGKMQNSNSGILQFSSHSGSLLLQSHKGPMLSKECSSATNSPLNARHSSAATFPTS